MLKIKVNSKYSFEIQSLNGDLTVDGKQVDWDIIKTGEGKFHVIKDRRSYNAEVIKADSKAKLFTIKINNAIYNLEIKNRFDMLLKELGMDSGGEKRINELKAPMPGLVLNVMVKEGQKIDKETSVLVLEAMKMENILKAPGDGTIKNVNVKKGDAVEKNQVLMVLK